MTCYILMLRNKIFRETTTFLMILKTQSIRPKGDCEFCFPETLNVCRANEGNTEVEGKQIKLTVSRGVSHLVFCYTTRLKNRKKKL